MRWHQNGAPLGLILLGYQYNDLTQRHHEPGHTCSGRSMNSGRTRGLRMEKRLDRPLNPCTSSISFRVTLKVVARKRTNCSLAFPSTGGAMILICNSPFCMPENPIFDALGWMRTWIVSVSPSQRYHGSDMVHSMPRLKSTSGRMISSLRS